MYCYNCGKEIDDKAVVCVHCGVETKNMKSTTDKNIVIIICCSYQHKYKKKKEIQFINWSNYDLCYLWTLDNMDVN